MIPESDTEYPPEPLQGGRRLSPWWLFVAVIVIASALRIYGLDHPAEVYFDETYYANDAVVYLEGPEAFRHNLDELYGGESRETEVVPMGAMAGEISWVHPPLGKWIIAAGIGAFGKNPWGWRIPSVIFGIAAVAITYLTALVLWRRHSWAFVAGLLIALDGLAIVESRVAMLDIFVSAFIALAFLFAACEKRRMDKDSAAEWAVADGHPALTEFAGTEPDPMPAPESAAPPVHDEGAAGTALFDDDAVVAPDAEDDSAGYENASHERPPVPIRQALGLTRWKLLTGVALGAAIATKWTGVWAIMSIALLFGIWAVTDRRPRLPRVTSLARAGASIVICLFILPGVIYLASYADWFTSGPHGSILSDPAGVTENFINMQTSTLRYHRTLDAAHPYQSTPATWPWMTRPIAYWYEELPGGERGHILAVGNPGVWWPFIALVPVVLAFGIRRRDWRDGLILVAYFGIYLPWIFNPRTAFFYYMTPVVPFMALAIASAARRVPEALRPGAGLLMCGFAAIGCIAWYPIWTGIPIAQQWWERLMLFSSWI